jgi:hypothetical protein
MAAHHHPAPALLINHCLLPKITDDGRRRQQLLHGGFFTINEADVYSKPPHELATEHAPVPSPHGEAGEWYFFTRLRYTSGNQTRPSRAVVRGGAAAGGSVVGRWQPETGKTEVEGTVGGYATTFCYYYYKEKAAAEWVRTGWLMAEYSYGSSDTVLCKVYYVGPTTHSHHQEEEDEEAAPYQAQAGEPPLPGVQGLLQEAERLLMSDEDDDMLTMALLQIPQGVDTDAFFQNYLLGDGEGETAPPPAARYH